MATKKKKELTIITDGKLVIDDSYVRKLVPEEFDEFAKAFDDASFDGPDDYSAAVSDANNLLDTSNYPKSLELVSDDEIESSELNENTADVSKALAKLNVAAFKKGVDLTICSVYNDCEADIKFALNSSAIQITLSDAGKKMLDKLGVTGTVRLADLDS
jgi:hypothetical protein